MKTLSDKEILRKFTMTKTVAAGSLGSRISLCNYRDAWKCLPSPAAIRESA